jgi:hypothetical protein
MKTWKKLKFKTKKWANTLSWSQVTPGAVPERPPKPTQPGILYADRGAQHLQAARVLTKFGGARELMRALKAIGRHRNPASIFKWTYPYPKGTGGLIPSTAWDDILAAARHEGIVISQSDMDVSVGQEPTEDNFVAQKRFAERYPRHHGRSYMTKVIAAEREGMRQMVPRKNWIKTVAQTNKEKRKAIEKQKALEAKKKRKERYAKRREQQRKAAESTSTTE